MKARLKRILQAAAGLTASLGLAAAILTANQQDAEPLTCPEWEAALASLGDEQVEFFLAASTTYIQAGVPTVSATRVLGTCAQGECVIPTPCGTEYRYPFDLSPAVNGWRLARAYAHPYIAGGWQELATTVGPSSLRYWSVRSAVVTTCTGLMTLANCRTLLAGVDDCWLRSDGQQCRAGRLYGPGLGGVNPDGTAATCSPQVGDAWIACSDGPRGRGWAATTYNAPAPVELDFAGGGG